jgi:hypothetical protein
LSRHTPGTPNENTMKNAITVFTGLAAVALAASTGKARVA